MEGNNHYWAAQDPAAPSGGHALTEAMLAVAHELRTANLIALQSTPGWLDEARARLGNPTAPEIRVSADPKQDGATRAWVDPRCSKPLMDGRNEIRCWLPANHPGECK